MTAQQNLNKQRTDALAAKDPSQLDLALRALYHFAHRGKSVDTSAFTFGEVLKLDPNFYG